MASTTEQDVDGLEIDPIWTTSRTARQIYVLGEVDKVCIISRMSTPKFITGLGHHAALSISCLFYLAADASPDGCPR